MTPITITYTETPFVLGIIGLAVTACAHFGIIVSQNDIVAVLGGVLSLYGALHGWYVARKTMNAAVASGVSVKK